MLKTFISSTIGREFESEVPADEEVLDGVILRLP